MNDFESKVGILISEHYEKFLELWKKANPEIAELEDAKKRLTGLKCN